jgi:hypothetical protein
LGAVVVVCCWAGSVIAGAAQQIVDPDFRAGVEYPVYSGNGPTVAIDEAHSNFHTAAAQYAPFAALLKNDGYRVTESTRPFAADALTGISVLVVANARNLKAIMAGDISKPAFTEQECEEVRDWVRSGGSLLLIADHAPYGNAAQNLAERFGVGMGKGWAFERRAGSRAHVRSGARRRSRRGCAALGADPESHGERSAARDEIRDECAGLRRPSVRVECDALAVAGVELSASPQSTTAKVAYIGLNRSRSTGRMR